jgi:hypothetical protein
MAALAVQPLVRMEITHLPAGVAAVVPEVVLLLLVLAGPEGPEGMPVVELLAGRTLAVAVAVDLLRLVVVELQLPEEMAVQALIHQ